jgi:hypothetical protein
MSIFSDLLYPDNPKRREEVRSKTAMARNAFLMFNTSWNNYAISFNKMVNEVINQEKLPWKEKGEFRLPNVSLNPDVQTVEEMVNKINEVIEFAKANVFQFNESVKATLNPKDAEEFSKLTDYDNIGDVEKWLEWSIPTTVGVSISIYLGIAMARGLKALALNGISISLGLKAIGGLSIGILSAVGFVVTDLIVAAITGATEREKLENANKQLDDMMEKIINPLNEMNIQIAGQTSQIDIGRYWIAEDTMLIRKKENNWVVYQLSETIVTTNTIDNQQGE